MCNFPVVTVEAPAELEVELRAHWCPTLPALQVVIPPLPLPRSCWEGNLGPLSPKMAFMVWNSFGSFSRKTHTGIAN